MSKAASGMVSRRDLGEAIADADAGHTTVASDKVPHLSAPAILQAAQAGIGLVAGQNVQLAAGDTATLMSGEDTNLAVAGAARIHSGQAIGLLAGAIEPGEDNTGIRLIAAKDDIDLQAQSDELKLLARDKMKLVSASANIDFAAAKKIVLSVEGGASITIDGGITVACPGTITVHASKKSFGGPTSLGYAMPTMPRSSFEFQPFKLDLQRFDTPGPDAVPMSFAPWEIVIITAGGAYEGTLLSGTTDENGRILLDDAQQETLGRLYAQRPNDVWLSLPGKLRPLDVAIQREDWSPDTKGHHASAALDYSDHAPLSLGSDPHSEVRLSRLDHGKAPASLWAELRDA